jgi:dienelactone hydrolase
VKTEIFVKLKLQSAVGFTDVHYYEAPNTERAVIWVGGVGGGFDTPAKNLYPRLSEELKSQGISSLRVKFRNPTDLSEAIEDVLVGVEFLRTRGVKQIALVGHSFGGAVVISAGVLAGEDIKTVVTLATQSYGTNLVSQLSPASLLLIHGRQDNVLPVSSSQHVFSQAHEPKSILIYAGATHCLDEVADEVTGSVRDWLLKVLKKAA